MTKVSYNVTSVGEAPGAERGQRMKKYVLTMSIRMACIVAMPFVEGWWVLACAIGAVFLPYIAVIIANVSTRSGDGAGVEHATLELTSVQQTEPPVSEPSDIILVDDSAIRITAVQRIDKDND